jgi:hypothetical protein
MQIWRYCWLYFAFLSDLFKETAASSVVVAGVLHVFDEVVFSDFLVTAANSFELFACNEEVVDAFDFAVSLRSGGVRDRKLEMLRILGAQS